MERGNKTGRLFTIVALGQSLVEPVILSLPSEPAEQVTAGTSDQQQPREQGGRVSANAHGLESEQRGLT